MQQKPYPAGRESGNVFMPEYGEKRGHIVHTFPGNAHREWSKLFDNGGKLIEKKRK